MLLDDIRSELMAQGYSVRAERRNLVWIKRYMAFHKNRHPAAMRGEELNRFLLHLSPASQLPALRAVLFLYTRVLDVDIKELGWPAALLDPGLAPHLWSRLKAACRQAGQAPLPASVVLAGRPVG